MWSIQDEGLVIKMEWDPDEANKYVQKLMVKKNGIRFVSDRVRECVCECVCVAIATRLDKGHTRWPRGVGTKRQLSRYSTNNACNEWWYMWYEAIPFYTTYKVKDTNTIFGCCCCCWWFFFSSSSFLSSSFELWRRLTSTRVPLWNRTRRITCDE